MALFGKKSEVDHQEAKPSEPVLVDEKPSVSAGGNFKTTSDLLVQPRVSEKAGQLANLNKYIFKVKTRANKLEVRKAVEHQYGVKVLRVNMITGKGKQRVYGRTSGRMSNFKKAIVTLKPGDKIDIALETV